jgi:hypothetical protein
MAGMIFTAEARKSARQVPQIKTNITPRTGTLKKYAWCAGKKYTILFLSTKKPHRGLFSRQRSFFSGQILHRWQYNGKCMGINGHKDARKREAGDR